MTPSPIRKVLSTLRRHRVRALVIGGQACIMYGGAEFSRDIDVAVLADDANLVRLSRALEALQAEPVYVPPLSVDVLLRGHACHFRCWAAGVERIRLDVMSVMHGCDEFGALWSRRRTITLSGVGRVHVLSLPDLVQAKKTQRDKDWPMIRRLIEADYHNRPGRPRAAQIQFWFEQARTPELLLELCRRYPAQARRRATSRAAVRWALAGETQAVQRALRQEEDAYRAWDRDYWQPLRAELRRWRRTGRRS